MSDAAKELIFDEEAREKLGSGISQLADVVAFTLGPKGRNVGLEKSWGTPTITNDGNSIIRDVELENQYENMGASIGKEAIQKTKDVCGDGTTTTAILLKALVEKGLKQIASGSSPILLKRGMEKAVEIVVQQLEKTAIPVETVEEKKNIATVSASGDAHIGGMIAEAFSKGSVVTIEENKKTKDEIDVQEGMQLDRGYLSPYFCTNFVKLLAELSNPLILLTDKKINSVHDILPLLQQIASTGQQLLIIADDLEGDTLASLVANKVRGYLNVAAIKAPGFGDRRKAVLEDIAALTGGTVIAEEKGMSLKDTDLSLLGKAETIRITKDSTLIINGGGSSETISNRIAQIDREMTATQSEYEKENLEERRGKLSGGVVVIRVGGSTDPEVKEKKAKFQDALNSTKAAIEEGIVVGGGVALLRASEKVWNHKFEGDERIGAEILVQACQAPMRQIVTNTGYDGSVVLAQVENEAGPVGFNAMTEEIENLLEAGVVDPVKVVKHTLLFAASSAGVMWLSEVLIGNAPEDEEE